MHGASILTKHERYGIPTYIITQTTSHLNKYKFTKEYLENSEKPEACFQCFANKGSLTMFASKCIMTLGVLRAILTLFI